MDTNFPLQYLFEPLTERIAQGTQPCLISLFTVLLLRKNGTILWPTLSWRNFRRSQRTMKHTLSAGYAVVVDLFPVHLVKANSDIGPNQLLWLDHCSSRIFQFKTSF